MPLARRRRRPSGRKSAPRGRSAETICVLKDPKIVGERGPAQDVPSKNHHAIVLPVVDHWVHMAGRRRRNGGSQLGPSRSPPRTIRALKNPNITGKLLRRDLAGVHDHPVAPVLIDRAVLPAFGGKRSGGRKLSPLGRA